MYVGVARLERAMSDETVEGSIVRYASLAIAKDKINAWKDIQSKVAARKHALQETRSHEWKENLRKLSHLLRFAEKTAASYGLASNERRCGIDGAGGIRNVELGDPSLSQLSSFLRHRNCLVHSLVRRRDLDSYPEQAYGVFQLEN